MESRIDENAFNKAWNNNVGSKLNAFVVRNIIENYEAARAPVSVEAGAEAAHNSYWADEYKNAREIEKAAARQQVIAIAKVWGLSYAD